MLVAGTLRVAGCEFFIIVDKQIEDSQVAFPWQSVSMQSVGIAQLLGANIHFLYSIVFLTPLKYDGQWFVQLGLLHGVFFSSFQTDPCCHVDDNQKNSRKINCFC